MVKINPSINPSVARLLLKLCVETGADEAIGEIPVNRFDLLLKPAKSAPKTDQPKINMPTNIVRKSEKDPVTRAQTEASQCNSLVELRNAISNYPHCKLRESAQNLVFSDGNPEAKVMLLGEAPGVDEDRQGKPFVGRSGKLLNRMFAEIDLHRDNENSEKSIYLTNVIPWRPPGNRNPNKDEIAMMGPFAKRHIELVKPDILVAIGNFSCLLLLNRHGVTKLRGKWEDWNNIPVMPMYHPAYLLRRPTKKADSWHDLLMIRSRLNSLE